jgi:hypothetical protein
VLFWSTRWAKSSSSLADASVVIWPCCDAIGQRRFSGS